jgi:hypothetical protein
VQDLLEQFRADEEIENALLIDRRGRGFHVVGEPAPALRIGDVRKFDANASAIDAAGFLSEFAFGRQLRVRLGAEKSKRIELGLDVSPSAEKLKNALTLAGRFEKSCGTGMSAGLASVLCHTFTSIKDARGFRAIRGRERGSLRFWLQWLAKTFKVPFLRERASTTKDTKLHEGKM